MPIKFDHSGSTYEADTPEQATQLIEWLDKREVLRGRAEHYHTELAKVLRALSHVEVRPSPWTPELFDQFLSTLGGTQIVVLETLTSGGTMTDDALRAVAGVPSNQALSGVLSGISKQATRLHLSPRDVFWIENIRKERRRRSVYHIAGDFRMTADQRSWPPRKLVW